MSRPSWDITFMNMAMAMAARGTCKRAQTGCVIVSSENQILAAGYNGAPRGLPHCLDEGCIEIHGHCFRAVHAEQNAICQAAIQGVSINKSVAYCTHEPCPTCGRLLIQSGVMEIVYGFPYGQSQEQEVIRAMYAASFVKVRQL